MSGKWLSVLLVDQLLRIAVVCADEHLSVHFLHCVHRSAHAFVHRFDSLDRRRFHAGVSYHIRIGKVDDDHVIGSGLDRLHQLVAYFICAHLRLQVIGGNLGGLNKDPVLAFIGLFYAAVEEEGNMSVFFRLCQTRLLQAVLCKELSECIGDLFLCKSNQLVLDRHIIFREANIGRLDARTSVKAAEIVITEGSCDLSCAVRTEIVKDDGVIVLDRSHRSAVLHHNRGKHKFIRRVRIIGSLDSCRSGLRSLADPLYQRVVGFFHTLPAVIPVHRVITSHHACDLTHTNLFHLFFQLFYVFLAGCRRRITSVQEAVYIHLLNALPLRQLQQSVNVFIVAVHASVGYQSEHMQRGVMRLYIFAGCQKSLVLKKVPVLDRLCDLGQILVYDPAGAHIQMPDLRIAHLSVRQPHCKAACISLDKRILGHRLVHDRGLSLCNGISFCIVI